jgi:hypothetical protein
LYHLYTESQSLVIILCGQSGGLLDLGMPAVVDESSAVSNNSDEFA